MGKNEIDAALAGVEAARVSLLNAWRAWFTEQAEHLRSSLLEEGKLTATNQPDITVEVGERTADLREALTNLAREHGSRLAAKGGQLTEVPEESEQEIWGQAVEDARVEFGRLFRRYGYRPSYRPSISSWGTPDDWEFYVPSTGTMRHRFLPLSDGASSDLTTASRALDAAERTLKTHQDAATKKAAQDLWGD